MKLDEKIREMLRIESPELTVKLSSAGLSYSIKAPNRDWVLTTQADILERLHNMIYKDYYLPYILAPIVGLLFDFLIHILFIMYYRREYDKRISQEYTNYAKTPLRSYIFDVEDEYFSYPAFYTFVYLSLPITVMLGYLIFIFLQYLFPSAVFAIGDQIQAYESLKNIRRYILFGVILTLIISFIASVFANWYTLRRA